MRVPRTSTRVGRRASGVGTLLDALKRKGGPSDLIENGRLAAAEFERMPTETLLLDLFVHRSMTEVTAPKLRHFARLPQDIDASDPSHELPIATAIHDLGRHPIVATPLVNDYETVLAAALARAGWNLSDFRCFRVVYQYPPTISTVLFSYPLPAKPGAHAAAASSPVLARGAKGLS